MTTSPIYTPGTNFIISQSSTETVSEIKSAETSKVGLPTLPKGYSVVPLEGLKDDARKKAHTEVHQLLEDVYGKWAQSEKFDDWERRFINSRPCKIHFKPTPSADLSLAVG